MKITFDNLQKASQKLLLAALVFTLCNCSEKAPDTFEADIIVYGGSSAAVTAAVETAQSGKSVIMVSPDVHPGGLTSGGLGWTDTGRKETIGGLARTFYQRVYDHYQSEEAWPWMKK